MRRYRQDDWSDEGRRVIARTDRSPHTEPVNTDYELDIIREDDDYADPYKRAVNAQRRSREGLPLGRDLHYEERQIVHMLDALHEYRSKADVIERKIRCYVADSKNLRTRWDRFIKTGGIYSADFAALIRGEPAPVPVHRRGALRLVVNNTPPKRKMARRMLNRSKMKLSKRGRDG
jgi:hypothetical protein